MHDLYFMDPRGKPTLKLHVLFLLTSNLCRIQYGPAVVLFDFSHQVHLEAGMNMIVTWRHAGSQHSVKHTQVQLSMCVFVFAWKYPVHVRNTAIEHFLEFVFLDFC